MNTRPACKINDLKYPAADNISSRTSTLCRSMACTLMKRDACSPQAEKEWMTFFPKKTCAYCGNPATHLDHLYAMIDDRRPTGYGTEPNNLVPCCGKCNQSKGKMHWEDFMRNGNCNHLGTEQNPDPSMAMQERIDIIKAFQAKMPAQHVNIDAALMADWDKLLATLDQALVDADTMLERMKKQLYAVASGSSQGQTVINANVRKATNSRQTPAITLLPPDPDVFKSELLQKKRAIITWVYCDGTQEDQGWNASQFQPTSSVKGNLQSRPQWRNKETRGLIEVRVRIV